MSSLLKTRMFQLTVCIIAVIGVLALLAPPTAHAVAAALVQVTNTISSPAITQPVPSAASQMVLLTTANRQSLPQGTQVDLVQIDAVTDLGSTTYVVPAGDKLVITEIDIGTHGGDLLCEIKSGTVYLEGFFLTSSSSTETTRQFRFASGIVFPAGHSVTAQNFAGAGTIGELAVHGYLTAM